MNLLVDTNIALRRIDLQARDHPVVVAALTALRRQRAGLFLAPQNLVEFWSVATRPASVNGLGLGAVRVDRIVRRLEHKFTILPETPAIFSEWRRLVVAHGVIGKQVHDARLVAAMRVHGIDRILTFNTGDFARYPGIVAVHPSSVVGP